MKVKSGAEIVDTHREYEDKISELEAAMAKLGDLSHARGVLEAEQARLRGALKALETTRFQALDPVTVVTSALGGHDYSTNI